MQVVNEGCRIFLGACTMLSATALELTLFHHGWQDISYTYDKFTKFAAEADNE